MCVKTENISKKVALKLSKQNKTCSNTKTKPSLCRGKKRKQIKDMNLKDADSEKVKKALKNKGIHIKNSPESRKYFKRYLDEMVKCNSYQDLQDMCKTFSSEIDDINMDPHIINVLSLDVEIDTEAAEYMPYDLPEENL